MRQITLDRSVASDIGRGIQYGPIEQELAAAEGLLAERLRSPHAFLDELLRYGCMLGGKRLRPALLLCAAKAVGEVNPAHITLAAAIEMIHTATLVHDDVLDGATTRRHLATVNSRWDDEAAILLGDFLFTHAFSMVCDLKKPYAARVVSQTTRAICEGELQQKGSRGNFAMDESAYLSIIEAKTAELCACSAQLGAYFAGADETAVRALAGFGRQLGIAFQIADDILDLVGDERKMGKSLGTDLEKRKPTLPMIRLLQIAEPSDRRELLRSLEGSDEADIEFLRERLDRYDAIDYARDAASKHVEFAQRELQNIPDSPARHLLHEVAEFAVSRAV